MRLIDADELTERVINLEAVALKQVVKLGRSEEHEKWKVWSAILTERTAFKYDLFDAPTVDHVKHGSWIKVEDDYNNHLYECSCCHTWTSLPTEEVNDGNIRYCWSCGARMGGVTK